MLQLMIEASGEESDSDEEEEESEAQAAAECPAHKTATKTAKGVMTDKEVVENSFLFLFAGNETTATSLAFSAYFLALNPHIQEKLQSEIDAYFEDKPVSDLIHPFCVKYFHFCFSHLTTGHQPLQSSSRH